MVIWIECMATNSTDRVPGFECRCRSHQWAGMKWCWSPYCLGERVPGCSWRWPSPPGERSWLWTYAGRSRTSAVRLSKQEIMRMRHLQQTLGLGPTRALCWQYWEYWQCWTMTVPYFAVVLSSWPTAMASTASVATKRRGKASTGSASISGSGGDRPAANSSPSRSHPLSPLSRAGPVLLEGRRLVSHPIIKTLEMNAINH